MLNVATVLTYMALLTNVVEFVYVFQVMTIFIFLKINIRKSYRNLHEDIKEVGRPYHIIQCQRDTLYTVKA